MPTNGSMTSSRTMEARSLNRVQLDPWSASVPYSSCRAISCTVYHESDGWIHTPSEGSATYVFDEVASRSRGCTVSPLAPSGSGETSIEKPEQVE